MRRFFPLPSPPLSSPAGPYAIQGKYVIRIQIKEGNGRNIDWFKKGEGGEKVGGGGCFFPLSSAFSILHFLPPPPPHSTRGVKCVRSAFDHGGLCVKEREM